MAYKVSSLDTKYLLSLILFASIACESNHTESQKDQSSVVRVKHYYESGEVLREFDVNVDSVKSGQYLNYYPNGNVRQHEYYRNGVKDGLQKTYFPDGKIESLNEFAMGHMTGPFEWYYPSGKIKTRGIRKNDRVEGEVQSFYESGATKSISNYENDRKIGEEKLLFESGETWSLGYLSSRGKKEFQINYTQQGEIDTISGSAILEVQATADSYKRNIKCKLSFAVPEGTVGELKVLRHHRKEEGEELEYEVMDKSQTISLSDDFRYSREGKYTYLVKFDLIEKVNATRLGTYTFKFYVLHGRTLEVAFP